MLSHKNAVWLSCFAFFFMAAVPAVVAQQSVLSVKDALQRVQANFPRLEAYRQQTAAATQNIALAKNSLLPDITTGYQANYATFNNISGMSYPGLMMPLTGPPATGNSYHLIPGSALAVLAKWEPFTFGQRGAAIEKATAQFQLANAAYSQELFRQQYAVVYTYMNAVYLHRLLAGLQANCNRVETALVQSLELARQGIKPGIDTIQLQSLLAQARVSYLGSQREYESQLIELTRLTGISAAPDALVLSDTLMAANSPVLPDTSKTTANNPVLQYYQSRRQLGRAALKQVQASWRPHLDIWGNAYARGSGVEASGVIDKSYGFELSRTNYGLGFQLSFPILRFSEINLQKKQYQSSLRSDEAMVSQAELDLQKQWQTAVAGYTRNGQIAVQATLQEQSAAFAYDGLSLSYKTGLIDYTRLVQGQYELLNAEVGRAGAYLQVWKSLLDMAVAKGDLTLVLDQLK